MAGSLSWHELAWNKPRGLISSNRSGKLLDEMLINSLVMTILSTAAWACLFPDETLALLAEVKRVLRLRMIHRHGEANARVLKRKLLDYAVRQGIDLKQVEGMLAEQHASIVERLGSQAADEILGETDPSEGCK